MLEAGKKMEENIKKAKKGKGGRRKTKEKSEEKSKEKERKKRGRNRLDVMHEFQHKFAV